MSGQSTLSHAHKQESVCQSCGDTFTQRRKNRVQLYCSRACAGVCNLATNRREIPDELLAASPLRFDTLAERKACAKRLKTEGYTFPQMQVILGVSKSTIWKICADREDAPTPRRRRPSSAQTYDAAGAGERSTPLATGTATELLVAAKLLLLGFDVWKPVMDRHRSDLGVFVNDRIVRLQTKMAGYDTKHDRYRAILMTKKKGRAVRYQDGEFEFFVVKCAGLEDYYVIPSAVGNRTGQAIVYPTRDRLSVPRKSLEKYRNNFDLLRGASC